MYHGAYTNIRISYFVLRVNILMLCTHAPFSWAARHTTVCPELFQDYCYDRTAKLHSAQILTTSHLCTDYKCFDDKELFSTHSKLNFLLAETILQPGNLARVCTLLDPIL